MSFQNFKTWTYRILSTAMVVLWMVIIYSYSAQPAEESGDLSGRVSYDIVAVTDDMLQLDWDEEELQTRAAQIDYPIRKVAHMTEYAILAGFTFLMLGTYGMSSAKGAASTRIRYLSAVAATFLYACTDEYHQTFVPGRAGKFTDVCIDTTGGIILLVIIMLILHKVEKHTLAKKTKDA